MVTQYGVLPLAGLVALGVSCWRLWAAQAPRPADALLAYLSVAGLLLFLRALHRHCLGEGFQPSFLVFVAAALPLALPLARPLAFTLVGVIALAWSTMVLPAAGPGLKQGPWFEFPSWNAAQGRNDILPLDWSRPTALKAYLDANLRPDQTFADLTNSHLLYALTNRRFPFFHHATQVVQFESPQRLYLKEWEKLLAADKLPLVLVNADFWGARIDQIPSTMSLYLISELIYQRYEPVARFSEYELWRVKSAERPLHQPPPFVPRQGYQLRKLPLIWGTRDARRPAANTPVLATLLAGPRVLGPGQSLELPIAPSVRRPEGNYVHLRLTAPAAGNLVLNVTDKGGSELGATTFEAEANPEPRDYLLRVSSLAAWYRAAQPFIVFANHTGAPLQVESIVVRAGD